MNESAIKGHAIRSGLKRGNKLLRIPVITILNREIVNNKFLPPKTPQEDDKNYNPINFNLKFEATQIHQQIERKIVLEFNKNKDIILPGQISTLSVWYNSHGYNQEMMKKNKSEVEIWELITEPKISSLPILFNFHGYFNLMNNSTSDWNTSVNKFIMDLYLQCETWEFIQGIILNLKNLNYIYFPAIVEQFKKMFNEAAENTLLWDLSLDELRDLLLKINNIDNKVNRRTLLETFFTLCRDSLKPSCIPTLMNTKYGVVYKILCVVVNKFEDECEFVERHCLDNIKFQLKSETESQSELTRTERISSASQNPQIDHEKYRE
ncbi:hypothetical protein PV327_002834 [Microctonus hyperodae]|uniref:Uncharacterized protein n=1 Tax=Microctonus hyperodae TaxID=165561 RepID=A0AA39KPG5_MICHY|nr:hypothetical protein PV327_002834 [Microctonus hyperodae]